MDMKKNNLERVGETFSNALLFAGRASSYQSGGDDDSFGDEPKPSYPDFGSDGDSD